MKRDLNRQAVFIKSFIADDQRSRRPSTGYPGG
jgi:hypothetical protein